MPFFLKLRGDYVYVKRFKSGDTTPSGDPWSEEDLGTLTFDDENGANAKAKFQFEEVDGNPNLKELRTGWFVRILPKYGMVALRESPAVTTGLVDASDAAGGILRTKNRIDWMGNEYAYVLPTSFVYSQVVNEDGSCPREGYVRYVDGGAVEYDTCKHMRWEFEDASSSSNKPIWNPRKREFWDVKNFPLWIYAGILAFVLAGVSFATVMAMRRS